MCLYLHLCVYVYWYLYAYLCVCIVVSVFVCAFAFVFVRVLVAAFVVVFVFVGVCVVVCAFVFGCVCSALRQGQCELRIGDEDHVALRIGCMAYASGLRWSCDGELRYLEPVTLRWSCDGDEDHVDLLHLGTRRHPRSIEKQVETVRSRASPRSYGLSGPVWKVSRGKEILRGFCTDPE